MFTANSVILYLVLEAESKENGYNTTALSLLPHHSCIHVHTNSNEQPDQTPCFIHAEALR